MDPRVERLKTPQECEAFICNARARGEDLLVKEAHRRAVARRTDAYGPKSPLERECVEAIYAYEEVMSTRNGRRIPATRIWQNVRKLGPFTAIDKAVSRPENESTYAALVELGLEQLAFEAVVVGHPQEFSFDAVEQSKARAARRKPS